MTLITNNYHCVFIRGKIYNFQNEKKPTKEQPIYCLVYFVLQQVDIYFRYILIYRIKTNVRYTLHKYLPRNYMLLNFI